MAKCSDEKCQRGASHDGCHASIGAADGFTWTDEWPNPDTMSIADFADIDFHSVTRPSVALTIENLSNAIEETRRQDWKPEPEIVSPTELRRRASD